GSALTVSASFTDPGVNDAPWSYAFDWGDGSAQTAGSTTSQATPLTATHTYQTAGTYSVRVTVTDRDGASGVGAKSVTVSTPAATVTLVGAGTIASCSSSGDEATAAILDATPGTVFSSGSTHGSMVGAQPLWQALYDAGAEIVISGHEHNYERFAPQTPGGALDLARGIRQFVVGTGGGSGAYPFGTPIANSEARITG